MKKILNYACVMALLSIALYSCSKFNSTDDTRNAETLTFENKSMSKDPKSPKEIKLDSQLDKTYIINYENDELSSLRLDSEWNDYLRKMNLTIDPGNVTKSVLKNSSVIMYSIPYVSGPEKGFLNVYVAQKKHFWTKVSIKKISGNIEEYTITTKDEKPIIQLNLGVNTMELSNLSLPKNELLQKEYNNLGVSANPPLNMMSADCITIRGTYLECLDCLIIRHCGNDVTCVIACTVGPYVCIGVAILACIGQQQQPYGQCGGREFPGPYSCQAPFLCVYINEFYSQCLPN